MKTFQVLTLLMWVTIINGLEPTLVNWVGSDLRIEVDDGNSYLVSLSESNPLSNLPQAEIGQFAHCNFIGVSNDLGSLAVSKGCIGSKSFTLTFVQSIFNYASYNVNDGVPTPAKSSKDIQYVDEVMIKPSDRQGQTESYVQSRRDFMGRPGPNSRLQLPYSMEMTLKIIYNQEFVDYHGGEAEAVDEIRSIVALSQAHFSHPTLTTNITLNVIEMEFQSATARDWAGEGDILEAITKNSEINFNSSANLHAIFCTDPLPASGSVTVGIAWLGVVCADDVRYRLSINEGNDRTINEVAVTLTHEIGHNLNMDHDFYSTHIRFDCTGLMDYASGGRDPPETWSKCNVFDLYTYYVEHQPWCMTQKKRPLRPAVPKTTKKPNNNMMNKWNNMMKKKNNMMKKKNNMMKKKNNMMKKKNNMMKKNNMKKNNNMKKWNNMMKN